MFDNLKNKITGKKEEKKDGKYEEMKEEKPAADVQQAPQWGVKPEQQQRPSMMDHLKGGLTSAKESLTAAKENVHGAFKKVDAQVKNAIVKQKKDLNTWIAAKVDEKVITTMGRMEPKLTKSCQDNAMPQCMKTFVADVVTKFWSDLTDMVRFELRVKMEEPHIDLSRQPDHCKVLCWWYKLRNWYLYAVIPYDMSFWEQVKRPAYIFWKILQSIPHFGIQAGVFFLLFIAIDKTEEFQLVNFILNYKTMQFLTAGCLSAISGYFTYFYCATILPSEDAKQDFVNQQNAPQVRNQTSPQGTAANPYQVLDLNYCFTMGPGSGMNLNVALFAYFFQVFLIWVAYFCLFRSKSKVDFIQDQLKVKKGLRGGRLTYFMIYDLICFLSAVAMTLIIYYKVYYIPGQPLTLYQEVEGLFYFAKLVYGTASFPFLIFAVGFFVQLFTTAKPTGYDTYGNVVPVTNKIKLVYSELPPEEDEQIDIEDAVKDDTK